MSDRQNEGFVRQRRNLLMVSLVLLFSEVTELKVEKISAFGNELLIGKPHAVTTALWVAGLYWLVRFYQYSRVEFHGDFGNYIQHRISEICAPTALKRLLRKDPSLQKTFHFEAGSSGSIRNSKPGYLEVDIELQKIAMSCDRKVVTETQTRRVRLDGADLFLLRVRAWIHLIVHTTLFTEAVLPYIVFALPVLYICYKLVI